MNFSTLVIRNERHVRLFFSSSPDPTAFTGTGTIALSNSDGLGIAPGIRARLAVPGTPTAMELVLDNDLAGASNYTLTLTALPGADATTVTTTAALRMGGFTAPLNEETKESDLEALIYGTDLVNVYGEFYENVSGDLATISGQPNVYLALDRRMLSSGIPWRSSYGTKPREFVDGTPAGAQQLVGISVRQMVLDPRVASAVARISPPDPNDVSKASIGIDTTLVGSGSTKNLVVNFK